MQQADVIASPNESSNENEMFVFGFPWRNLMGAVVVRNRVRLYGASIKMDHNSGSMRQRWISGCGDEQAVVVIAMNRSVSKDAPTSIVR